MWVTVSLTCKLCVCSVHVTSSCVGNAGLFAVVSETKWVGWHLYYTCQQNAEHFAFALCVRFRRFVLSLLYLYHCLVPRVDLISSWWRLALNFKMEYDVKFFATMFAWHHRRNLQISFQWRNCDHLDFFKLYCSLWCSDLCTVLEVYCCLAADPHP